MLSEGGVCDEPPEDDPPEDDPPEDDPEPDPLPLPEDESPRGVGRLLRRRFVGFRLGLRIAAGVGLTMARIVRRVHILRPDGDDLVDGDDGGRLGDQGFAFRHPVHIGDVEDALDLPVRAFLPDDGLPRGERGGR